MHRHRHPGALPHPHHPLGMHIKSMMAAACGGSHDVPLPPIFPPLQQLHAAQLHAAPQPLQLHHDPGPHHILLEAPPAPRPPPPMSVAPPTPPQGIKEVPPGPPVAPAGPGAPPPKVPPPHETSDMRTL